MGRRNSTTVSTSINTDETGQGSSVYMDNSRLETDVNISKEVLNVGGESLTNIQLETLERIKYNEGTDKIESTVPITTTLNSFYLGEQHKMSSGGENMFFTNLTSGINFFPMWGGIKDHSDVASRTVDGVIAPSGRVYGDFFSLVLGDVTNVGVYLPYEGSNTFGANISGLGITTTLGENLPNTIKLEYRLYIDDKIVYSQPLENENGYSKDDTLEWWFDHPVEIRQGTTIVAKITKVIKATNTDDGVLLVHSGVDTDSGLTRYQTTLHNRIFTDKNILLEGDINTDGLQAEIDLNTSERHEHANKTVLDNFGEDANQNPTYNGNTVDTIVAQRDVYDGLDSTNTTVSLSAAQGKVLKDVQVNQQLEIDSNTDKVGITNAQSAEIVVNSDKVGITNAQATNINENTLARHEHANKTVLDSFGEDENQQPTYNGNTVDTVVAQRDVYNRLDSTSTTISLSAAAGKFLRDEQVSQVLNIQSNTAKVGITPEQATNITDMSMKFLGEYRVDSGVSVPLILPNLSDIGSVEIRTSSAAPEEFYIRYNHDVAEDYVIYADFIHYAGDTSTPSSSEGITNSTPTYQTTVGRQTATNSWKRITPEFTSDLYRYAKINLSLVKGSTDSSTGGTLYAYELLVLTSRNLSEKVDVIQVFGRKK